MNLFDRIKSIIWYYKLYRKDTAAILIYPYRSLQPSKTHKAKIPIILRPITEEDAEKYRQVRWTKRDHFLERLSKGHIGMCAVYEDKIVAFNWAAKDEYFDNDILIRINLPEKYLYGYDAYTHPDYRRLGIHQELSAESFSEFIKRGYEFGVILVSLKNEKALRATEKAGARRLGSISSTIILGFKFHHVESIDAENEALISLLFSSV